MSKCCFKSASFCLIESHYLCPLRLANCHNLVRSLCYFFLACFVKTHTLFQEIAASNMNQIKVSSTETNRFTFILQPTRKKTHCYSKLLFDFSSSFVCLLLRDGDDCNLRCCYISNSNTTASITVIFQYSIKPLKFLAALFHLLIVHPFHGFYSLEHSNYTQRKICSVLTQITQSKYRFC